MFRMTAAGDKAELLSTEVSSTDVQDSLSLVKACPTQAVSVDTNMKFDQ